MQDTNERLQYSMAPVLLYTFFGYRKNSSKLLYLFENKYCDKLFIPNRFSTNKLVEKVSNYEVVIGLADHNKNATKSRFDPLYINKYGRRQLLIDAPDSYSSIMKPTLDNESYYSFSSATNGPCNRSAFLAMHRITSEGLKTKFLFFHLKKSYSSEDLANLIRTLGFS